MATNPQVILMSATIDCKQFAEYFSSVIKGRIFPANVFEVEGRTHRIDEFYMDDLQRLPPTVKRRLATFVCVTFSPHPSQMLVRQFPVCSTGEPVQCQRTSHFKGDVRRRHQSDPEF